MPQEPIIIVGAGLAGATAAVALRENGYDGEVVLVGAEPHLPYNRPPLSKTYLRSEERFGDILVNNRAKYTQLGVGLKLGAEVVAVSPREHRLTLASGELLKYSRLLLATGGRSRDLGIQRPHLRGVYSLRTVDDADRLVAEAAAGRHAVVVGLGFIGSEVTASLRQLGVEVTAIEPAQTPLNRVFGDEVGQVLADIHRDHGVELLLGDAPEVFEGDDEVTAIRTQAGRIVQCDFCVVGVGIQPNVEFLAGSGIAVDNGILVDEMLRTNVPDVFAAGDIANHVNALFGERMRLEHWNNAEWQGRAAALSMLGKGRPYAAVPNFWSDQYEYTLEYRGHHTARGELVIRGSLEDRSFLAFYLDEGRVKSVLALRRDEELVEAESLIERQARADSRRLRDEAFPLEFVAA